MIPADPHGPLHGLRILDASRVLAGPFCGMILGDLGAEVIKVERPGAGDETRAWGPPFARETSAYYLSCNRNKRAITLDLSKPEGRTLLYRLAEKSDVLLQNVLPSTAQKLGLSAGQLHAINPRLIICSITGFGLTGPMSETPGYDFAVQAMSGLMAITGPPEGPPSKVGVAIADVATGLYAGIAVLACLHARQHSGHGYAIDLALLDATLAAQVNVVQAFLTSGRVPDRQGNAHLQIVPYQLFQTEDSYLVLAIGNDGQWQRFCSAAQRPDLLADSRFSTNPLRVQHRADLIPMLDALLRERKTPEWQQMLEAADVPHSPVFDYAELMGHPQASARGLKVTVQDPHGQPVDLVNSPFRIEGSTLPPFSIPPRQGEHTHRVLKELLGMGPDEIGALQSQGVI